MTLVWISTGLANPSRDVLHNPSKKRITIKTDSLTLILSYERGCAITHLLMNNYSLLAADGITTRLQQDGKRWDSGSLDASPAVRVQNQQAQIGPFRLGPAMETWRVRRESGRLILEISRTLADRAQFREASMPLFHFNRMSDWDGALLGNGGVAWFKLFDTPQATYGVHVDKMTLWNQSRNIGLRVQADSDHSTALRLSRQTDGSLVCAFTVSEQEVRCRYDADSHRRRFLTDRQDVWSDIPAGPGTVTARFTLSALDYQATYGRGNLVGLDQEAVTSLLNTVARIGVIDTHLHGSNSWRTPYGPAVLHEQWIALLASAIADDDYIKAYQRTLCYFRDHAIERNGRVKSRWAYTCEDAIPGTCDSLGFYEAQWGYLLDANPDFVINVVELFDLCGDLDWLRTFKFSCEQVLQHLLDRDQDGDHLVEMMTDDHAQARGSDWIDIIWASYENSFVNALMYRALTLWADAEELLEDAAAAERYRALAAGLKRRFNQTTADGGLWDEERRCYIHWRDRDDSIHGRNMVTPVNFMAIAYGLCEDSERQRKILDRIENQMQKEKLFAWPICLDSYEKGEGLDWQFPFPNYENGDIFLGWGQVGVASYAVVDPSIALRYVETLLAQYRRDGLAFQRYLRSDQTGAGDDILANNAMTLVGLYRDIYGIQPKHNRLYLAPHLPVQLDGTQLIYRLAGRRYDIDLHVNEYRVRCAGKSIRCRWPFAAGCGVQDMRYYHGSENDFSLHISGLDREHHVDIVEWLAGRRMVWSDSSATTVTSRRYMVKTLLPNAVYAVWHNGKEWAELKSDAVGRIRFSGPKEKRSHFQVIKRL